MRAIIVDDEPRAIELITAYIKNFESIELLATFRNGLKALEFIAKNKIDVIFLDINMPNISGMAFSKYIKSETKIIFTTAYSEYAVESYKINAFDYLLKPISFDRFALAISRLLNQQKSSFNPETLDYLLIKSGNEFVRIKPEDILYLKKEGNYINYITKVSRTLARETVKDSLNKLPDNFIQAHKSYIINLNKVMKFDKENIYIDSISIPIGASFKNKVNKSLLPL